MGFRLRRFRLTLAFMDPMESSQQCPDQAQLSSHMCNRHLLDLAVGTGGWLFAGGSVYRAKNRGDDTSFEEIDGKHHPKLAEISGSRVFARAPRRPGAAKKGAGVQGTLEASGDNPSGRRN